MRQRIRVVWYPARGGIRFQREQEMRKTHWLGVGVSRDFMAPARYGGAARDVGETVGSGMRRNG